LKSASTKKTRAPRKRYISPATREEAYAVYYDALRRKVEDKGTENFPEQGGKKLYGELTMIVTVNHDGRVLDHRDGARLGQPRAGPPGRGHCPRRRAVWPLHPEMRRQADQIAMVARFKFTRDETLETNLTQPVSRQPLAPPSTVVPMNSSD
jgi:protein TonB